MAASADGATEAHSNESSTECSCRSNNCTECNTRRSLTSSLTSFDSYPVQLWRVFTATAKGFSIGTGIKGALAIFALVTRLRRRRLLPSPTKVEMASISSDAILDLKETLRYGLFLGAFAGTFASVDEIITALGGHHRTAKWRYLLAGAVAGPSMLLTGLNTQHTSLSVYILMRATVLASRCGIKSERFGRICKPLTWAHGDIFLMCLSSSQLLSAYFFKQDCLPLSYKSFINKHGGKDSVILNGLKEIASGLRITNLEAIEKFYESNGVNVKLDPEMKIPCSIIHGNQACTTHFFSFLLQAFKKALPVYLPVYLLPALVVHRQGLLKRPYAILWKCLFDTARSSLFLSTLSSSVWIGTCILFRVLKGCSIPMVSLGMIPTGLALAIEKKSRRIEISLYCLARAIESFFTWTAVSGYLPYSKNIKRTDVVIFSISTAIIMHCYAMERDVFRSKYLNVFDWVFGVPLPPYSTTPRKKQ